MQENNSLKTLLAPSKLYTQYTYPGSLQAKSLAKYMPIYELLLPKEVCDFYQIIIEHERGEFVIPRYSSIELKEYIGKYRFVPICSTYSFESPQYLHILCGEVDISKKYFICKTPKVFSVDEKNVWDYRLITLEQAVKELLAYLDEGYLTATKRT